MILQSKGNRFIFSCLLSMIHLITPLAADWQAPPEEFGSTSQPFSDLSAGPAGTGMVVTYNPQDGNVTAFSYTNEAWQPAQIIYSGYLNNTVEVSMNLSGEALAIWTNDINEVLTSYYNGSSWTTPTPSPLDTITFSFFQQVDIAMNNAGNGLAVWQDALTSEVRSSKFSAGTWSPIQVIGSATGTPLIAYAANGSAVSAFNNGGVITVVNYIGGIWQLPISLATGVSSTNVQVGISANGHALAAWVDNLGNVNYSFYDGFNWSSTATISSSSGNSNLISLAMAPNGTAVIAYIDSLSNGHYSMFDGTSFGSNQIFATNISTINPSVNVSVDENGSALIVYDTPTEIRSRFLNPQGVLSSDLLINTTANTPYQVKGALTSNGVAFALWQETSIENTNSLGSAFIPNPTPPRDFEGKACKNKFSTQIDFVHILSWKPSTDLSVVGYILKRNDVTIATIAFDGPFIYFDHNRPCADRYTLTSVTEGGFESEPLTVIVK